MSSSSVVVSREAGFRDRIRGELTWPWGVAEARELGLEAVLQQAGRVELPAVQFYEDQRVAVTEPFESVPMIGFSHPRLQEALFTWAGLQGATTLRPAKATGFAINGKPTVTVAADGRAVDYTARLAAWHLGQRTDSGRLFSPRSETGNRPLSQRCAADPDHR